MLNGLKLQLVLYQIESEKSKPNVTSVVPKGVETKIAFKKVDFTAPNLV